MTNVIFIQKHADSFTYFLYNGNIVLKNIFQQPRVTLILMSAIKIVKWMQSNQISIANLNSTVDLKAIKASENLKIWFPLDA